MAEILIKSKDGGEFMAYHARPATSGPAPALIVIQEIFGVNRNIRHTCDEWAKQGFHAIAPDVFWRLAPGVQLDPTKETDWPEALRLMNETNVDFAIDDLKCVLDYVRNMPDVTKAGVVGFCMGGKLTFLMGCRSDADAFVAYYGGGTDHLLNESSTLKRPMLMHFGGDDEHIDAGVRERISKGLSTHKNVEIHVYPGVGHAFARYFDANHRNEEAAQLSFKRSVDFFNKHLKG